MMPAGDSVVTYGTFPCYIVARDRTDIHNFQNEQELERFVMGCRHPRLFRDNDASYVQCMDCYAVVNLQGRVL